MARGNPRAAAESKMLARIGHLEWFNPQPDVHPVELAIRLLAPSRATADIRAIFDNRAHAGTIQNWRCGARKIPRWAAEMLRTKMHAEINRRYKIVDRLFRESFIGPGLGWNKNATRLREWRAKQNLQKRD